MRRVELGLLSSTLLLPVAAFLAVAGLVSDFMDPNEFAYHRYAGYVSVGLVAVHVFAHWPQLRACWKKKPGEGAVSGPAAEERRRAMGGKAERETRVPDAEVGSRHWQALAFRLVSGLTRRRESSTLNGQA